MNIRFVLFKSVSYTHLDVYKRQVVSLARPTGQHQNIRSKQMLGKVLATN